MYTRERKLPKEIIPELKEAAARVGRDWKDFVVTDNTCGPRPPPQPLLKVRPALGQTARGAAASAGRASGGHARVRKRLLPRGVPRRTCCRRAADGQGGSQLAGTFQCVADASAPIPRMRARAGGGG